MMSRALPETTDSTDKQAAPVKKRKSKVFDVASRCISSELTMKNPPAASMAFSIKIILLSAAAGDCRQNHAAAWVERHIAVMVCIVDSTELAPRPLRWLSMPMSTGR